MAGLDGIAYLVAVTQMKVVKANQEATRGAEQQARLIQQQKALRAAQKRLEDLTAGTQISDSDLARLREMEDRHARVDSLRFLTWVSHVKVEKADDQARPRSLEWGKSKALRLKHEAARRAAQKKLEEFTPGTQISASDIARLADRSAPMEGDIFALLLAVLKNAYDEAREDLKHYAEKVRHKPADDARLREMADPPARVARPWVLRVVHMRILVLLVGLAAGLIIGAGGYTKGKQAEIEKARARIDQERDAAARQVVTGAGGGTTTTSQAAASAPASGETPAAEATSETGDEGTEDYGGVAPTEATGEAGDEGSVDYGGIGPDTDAGPIVK